MFLFLVSSLGCLLPFKNEVGMLYACLVFLLFLEGKTRLLSYLDRVVWFFC